MKILVEVVDVGLAVGVCVDVLCREDELNICSKLVVVEMYRNG